MARSISNDETLSDDMVQEMYCRIDKYVKDSEKIIDSETGKINTFYIYVTIKNIYFQWFNQQRRFERFEFQEFDQGNALSDYDLSESVEEQFTKDEMEAAHQMLIDNIMEDLKQWYWYDEKLFKTYFLTDMSLRDVASETKISLTSIYNSVKNYKKYMIDSYAEDVEDFNNGDYHLIKNNYGKE